MCAFINNLLRIYRVTGDSMLPVLCDGQYVLASSAIKPKVDKLVVLDHPAYGVMVKRVTQLNDKHLLLCGENEQSLSSEQIGWLDIVMVKGVVVRKVRHKRI